MLKKYTGKGVSTKIHSVGRGVLLSGLILSYLPGAYFLVSFVVRRDWLLTVAAVFGLLVEHLHRWVAPCNASADTTLW